MKTHKIRLGLAALLIAVTAYCASDTQTTLDDFLLTGDLAPGQARFELSATVVVSEPKGADVDILRGRVALTGPTSGPRWETRAGTNGIVAHFERPGRYAIRLPFQVPVGGRDGWKMVEFSVAPAAIQPVRLAGLSSGTQLEFAGAARPVLKGGVFESFLPGDGAVRLSWKDAAAEGEGKLFYAAEMLSQISVSPGLMKQTALFDFKVMQGELMRLVIELAGSGEVTRVSGEGVLAWGIEPGETPATRLLAIQFNRPQKDQCQLQIQAQTALGAFPQSVQALRLIPREATRFGGYYRIVNEGAVRLEVARATGLSQVSPEQFPENDTTRAALRSSGTQRFVYKFSGADQVLGIQADQVQPELSVSELLSYHLAENETSIDAEIELEVREAPLRELLLVLPRGYLPARVNAPGLADYFLHDVDGRQESELRLVYSQPVSGRQIVELRLERNQPLGTTNWVLPRIAVPAAKSLRGHLGIGAEAGFRLGVDRLQGLTEIGAAFFPKKFAGLQSAFRLGDVAWEATLSVERLPQSVQADVLHLFSISEGIAYGSTLINYTVSGAPVSAFNIGLAEEYANPEFTGKDIRGWQKEDGHYRVRLHGPVSGSCALLVTYERPFKAAGETLAFTGARPLDAQSEQGHTLITSAAQFQVKPAEVSPGLLTLEKGEVPSEYRLFFDAPLLAAYRYVAQPVSLKLALSPLEQGDSLSQVIDRAVVETGVSKEGQVLTTVKYYVKSRGNPHLKCVLPRDTQLWAATVNAAAVVPVLDGDANLIPLPQNSDPNAVLTVELKLASRSKEASRLSLALPGVNAPVMLAQWTLTPDAGRRLVFKGGTVAPLGSGGPNGFGQLAQAFSRGVWTAAGAGVAGLVLLLTVACCRWAVGCRVERYSAEFILVLLLVAISAGLCGSALLQIVDRMPGSMMPVATTAHGPSAGGLTVMAPVQAANSTLQLEVENMEWAASAGEWTAWLWPVILGLALLGLACVRGLGDGGLGSLARVPGWVVLTWAALRIPGGGMAGLGVLTAFILLELLIPVMKKLWELPQARAVVAPSDPPASGAGIALLMCGLLLGAGNARAAGTNKPVRLPPVPVQVTAQLIEQEVRVEDPFAFGSAKIRWQAEPGDVLPLLAEPAILTRLAFPSNGTHLVTMVLGGKRHHQIVANRKGVFDLELSYQVRTTKRDQETGFLSPLPSSLVNRARITIAGQDVDVVSEAAASIQREVAGTNTVSRLVMVPGGNSWVGWKPRSRDLKIEKRTFYAELAQLYTPAAGVIEAVHIVSIRPAQGEIAGLQMDVPPGWTITELTENAAPASQMGNNAQTQTVAPVRVALWRFDPDTRKLRMRLDTPQSKPFSFLVRSQLPTGSLPFTNTVALLSVADAAGQIGVVGIATGSEVQLDGASAGGQGGCSPINLEDFPAAPLAALQGQIPGLGLRRAFRYGEAGATIQVRASAVEPDVRVETQDTLSLAEDRVVLAATATVDITRAGIFKLSFMLPPGMDVESVSGEALSHWTEARTDGGRAITLHLKGRTEGTKTFSVSLAGPGVKAARGWVAPQVTFREAAKMRGTLMVVPEQGLRLQTAASEGLAQLDPQKSGVKQKGVLAFRVLQMQRRLVVDLEQVDPWVQVNSLQQVQVNEGHILVSANLHYQIENTGVKTLYVRLPDSAESVRFQNELVTDFLPAEAVATNGTRGWEIKLQRRVLGPLMVQAFYQLPLKENATEATLRGIQTVDVGLQRGFVTVQSLGRLQVRVETLPATLQAAEWQSIPRSLQLGLKASPATFAFRLVDPGFELPLRLDRHEPARLLEARVKEITLASAISDDGSMLTQARLEMTSGDKRLLHVSLPPGAHFWFAFVNGAGVWPWREQERYLIPLEKPAGADAKIVVELFYSLKAGARKSGDLDLDLAAPKFDLPLENITWRVSMDGKWRVRRWTGALQLEQEEAAPVPLGDLQGYLQAETEQQQARTRQAEALLAAGNNALEGGDPQQARRSFQAAYGLSSHDAAFNEDARVQLHNVKLQQALVGLNVRQSGTAPEAGPVAAKLRELRSRQEANYTQQDAREIIERNSADDNAALMRLAERLVQQQDAALANPAALRANIPVQSRLLVFKRAVLVDPNADLRLNINATPAQATQQRTLIILGGIVLGMVLLLLIQGSGRTGQPKGEDAKPF